MAKRSGLAEQLYVGGRDVSGDASRINSIGSPRATLDVTGISQSAFDRVLGHGDGGIDFGSWFNVATDQEHDALSGLPTTDLALLFLISSVRGDPAAGLVAKQINYDPTRGADGSLEFITQAVGQGSPLEWGVMLTAGMDTHSSASTSATVDNGGSTSKGARGYMQHLSRASGTPTYVIQDSPDDSAWAALITFTTTGGASPTAQRQTVTGTIDRYARAQTTGSFSTAIFALMLARGTAEDDEDLS